MLTCQIEYAKKSKPGEEICGDSICVKRSSSKVVACVSDGLGSGVKASILSTLTTKMAATMLFRNIPFDEVFSSILKTLPVCRVRGISYANLCCVVYDAVINECTVVEYEFPVVLCLRNGQFVELEKEEKTIEGRKVSFSKFQPVEEDLLFVMTDGVSQAGMGTPHFPLGFGLKNILKEIESLLKYKLPPSDIVNHLVKLAEHLDRETRGDDALAMVAQFRPLYVLNIFVGPPEDRSKDEILVKRFMSMPGKKVICGGTTAQIFERILGKKVQIDLDTISPYSPPIGKLEGFELVTEGIVTLTQVFRYLEGQQKELGLAAQTLLKLMLEADEINFTVGRAINPAHQNPLFSHDVSLKFRLVHDVARILKDLGKIVNIDYC
ncbi:SpoIIE family protein phosphatase [Pseudothermotoga sp.]|nr:serine/threonine-protein phosphatase [Pseudothermotoga sp.]MCX7813629.1 serine/threonine-protein phosphatase [Pseudothermotoga sp.]MDW8139967.1 SpoIIE family protein phosphatase [Pseudothermotoga sp.]